MCVCMCVGACHAYVEVKGQLVGVGPLLVLYGFLYPTYCLYQLSHGSTLSSWYFETRLHYIVQAGLEIMTVLGFQVCFFTTPGSTLLLRRLATGSLRSPVPELMYFLSSILEDTVLQAHAEFPLLTLSLLLTQFPPSSMHCSVFQSETM